jgi:hypothetical protein
MNVWGTWNILGTFRNYSRNIQKIQATTGEIPGNIWGTVREHATFGKHSEDI